MAYITAKDVKKKRDQIRKAFPIKDGWKFSVIGTDHSAINIYLMQYPSSYNFGEGHTPVNHHSIADSGYGEKEKEVLNKINDIAHIGHWDKSDIQTDYFNCAYYVNLAIGKWDTPVVKQLINKDKTMTTKTAPKAETKTAPKAEPKVKCIPNKKIRISKDNRAYRFYARIKKTRPATTRDELIAIFQERITGTNGAKLTHQQASGYVWRCNRRATNVAVI